MDQKRLKAEYEAVHITEKAATVRHELAEKLALIVGGAKPSEIICIKNEKTGELFYTRCNRKER